MSLTRKIKDIEHLIGSAKKLLAWWKKRQAKKSGLPQDTPTQPPAAYPQQPQPNGYPVGYTEHQPYPQH
jgi:hypothetical protein